MKLRLLSAADMVKALPMAEAIEGMKSAYAQLSTGQAIVPLRSRVDVPAQGSALVMPAYLEKDGALAVKVVSVFPEKAQQGLPVIHALVMVLNSANGRATCIARRGNIDGHSHRSSFWSGNGHSGKERCDSVVVIGSGVQARTQLEAVCTVRDIEEVLFLVLIANRLRNLRQKWLEKGRFQRQSRLLRM